MQSTAKILAKIRAERAAQLNDIIVLQRFLKAGTHEGACSRSKAHSSAPTISSENICCVTKLLLPSFAPIYQTGLI